MAALIEFEREPSADRWPHDCKAQPRRNAEPAVDCLVLQREMPGEDVAAQRNHQPPWNRSVEPDKQEPAGIDGRRHDPGRALPLPEFTTDGVQSVSRVAGGSG